MRSVSTGIGKVGSKSPETIGVFLLPQEKRQQMHFIQTPVGIASQAFDGKCRSYEPGHAPHHIQLRLASESSRVPADWVGIESPSTVWLAIDGEVKSFYNHHADTIQDLINIHLDHELFWVERFRVLFVEKSNGGGFAFNFSAQPISACSN